MLGMHVAISVNHVAHKGKDFLAVAIGALVHGLKR